MKTWNYKSFLKVFLNSCIYLLIVLLTSFCSRIKEKNELSIFIDTSDIAYTMKGGLGASWHAISADLPLNNEKYAMPVLKKYPRGSAYGGNPPLENRNAWNQLDEHASWLGMNFVRVELSQRMYEPEKEVFDWENDEMQALYKILDWAQEAEADVFLQQMWSYVDWNAFPGIHPLNSAPKNLDDFANGIATLLEYLINDKGYSCIKYFCMSNEPPGIDWGYWWEYGQNPGNMEEAWARLKQEFDKRKIEVPISGPDWTGKPTFLEEKMPFAKYLGAIDIHSYGGIDNDVEENLKQYANWAHSQGKPFFLSEFGNMGLGWGGDNPSQKSFEAALSNANDIMRGMRAEVDGFNRWSYTNRGDLDGQWQLVQTFDREKKEYLSEVVPEQEAYFGFAIISRFLSKYSSVVKTEFQAPDSVLMCNAVLSPGGVLSIFMINNSYEPLIVDLNIEHKKVKDLQLYQITKELLKNTGFEFEPQHSYSAQQNLKISLPPKSISTLTENLLNKTDMGIIIN